MQYTKLFKINWKTVLHIDNHIYDHSPWKIKVGIWGKGLRQLFFQRPSIAHKYKNVDFLFFKSMKRDDYDQLFSQIIATCHHTKTAEDVVYYKRKVHNFFAFKAVIKYMPLFIFLFRGSPLKHIFLMTRLLQYLEIYEKLEKTIKYKTLVVFADMQPLDNFLVQMARFSNKPTVTLQHGLYIDYTQMENINSVNYKHHVSDFFLAWGNSTRTLIQRFHLSSKIVICGKPIAKPILQKEKSAYFTILFDQNLLKDYNKQLLDIAYDLQRKKGWELNIRFHPRNIQKDYQISKGTLINMPIESSLFILAHTTSLIHELLRIGIPVFKLDSPVPALNVPERLMFSDSNDVLRILEYPRFDSDIFEEEGKEFIQYIGEESLNQYKLFFDTINTNHSNKKLKGTQ